MVKQIQRILTVLVNSRAVTKAITSVHCKSQTIQSSLFIGMSDVIAACIITRRRTQLSLLRDIADNMPSFSCGQTGAELIQVVKLCCWNRYGDQLPASAAACVQYGRLLRQYANSSQFKPYFSLIVF